MFMQVSSFAKYSKYMEVPGSKVKAQEFDIAKYSSLHLVIDHPYLSWASIEVKSQPSKERISL
jgi:hypothetical protein